MKLLDLTEAHEQDYSAEAGNRWSNEELEIVFRAIKQQEFSKEEIQEVAKALTERGDFDRTANGAVFALNRMHILVHGSAPSGETESRAEKMFGIPDTMIKYADSKGYDTFENIKKAKMDLKGRPVRVREADAKKLMSDYYKANRASIPYKGAAHRLTVIKDIMAGLSPEEAFNRHK